jgi:hypothetical protein
MIPMSSLLRYYVESSICGHYATYALHTSVPDAFFTIVLQCEVSDWLEGCKRRDNDNSYRLRIMKCDIKCSNVVLGYTQAVICITQRSREPNS